MKVPCKDCKDRIVGCHSTCEKYISFQNYNNKIKEKKTLYNNLNDYFVKSNLNMIDRERKKL